MSKSLRQELAAELRAERFDLTPEGVYFPRQSVLAAGEYFDRVNGGEWSRTPNLVVNEDMAPRSALGQVAVMLSRSAASSAALVARSWRSPSKAGP